MRRVAVSLDVEALLCGSWSPVGRTWVGSISPHGRVTGLTEVDGGVRATVTDRAGSRTNVTVSVVGRTLVDDCDRDSGVGSQVVRARRRLVLAALDAGVTWTSSASRTAGEHDGLDEQERMIAQAAADLTRTELVRLVVAQAAADRLFAARVLERAGRLAPARPADLARARRVVKEAAEIPDGRRRWELHDLVDAGRAMVAELEVLAVGSPTAALVGVVEDSIGVWDRLAGYLREDWYTYETEPAEIGEALADVHQEMCARLRPDPVELGRRLAKLVRSADVESYLDVPDGYAEILGDNGMDAYLGASDASR